MQRQLPPLNALRAFEAAGRHQSFSRAAEELRVSHSSISRHVRGLEDRLGVQLFRDLPRGLELSRDGAVYLSDISPALDAIADATEALAETPAGTITVNSGLLFAQKWLVPRLNTFHTLHPEVEIRLETTSALVDVERYEADLAIRFVRPGSQYPGSELLSDAPLYPYAAPHLFPDGTPEPHALLAHRLYRDRNNYTWPTWFAEAGVAAADVPQTPWRMRSDLSLESAIAGHGVLLTSSEVVSLEVANGRLIQLSDIGFREGGYYLVSREGALRRKPVRAFRQWLLAQTAQWRGEDGEQSTKRLNKDKRS